MIVWILGVLVLMTAAAILAGFPYPSTAIAAIVLALSSVALSLTLMARVTRRKTEER